ncbi:MAG: hypothetical protein U9R15_18350, partial [Chloroflexota bacterium]|nr:hypothetical protein [Chloroflexota bacterium]
PDVGAIVTNLHYRMLVKKFLADNGAVAAAQVLDQFYKEPALPAPAEPEVVARAIQLGVQEGALGLAEMSDGEIAPETLRYGEQIPLLAVSFDEGVYVLSRERCEEIVAQMAPELEGIGKDAQVTGAGEVGAIETSVETIPEPTPPTKPTEKRYHRVRLVVADVPVSRIADVNRGVFMPLSAAAGEITFTMEIDVSSEEGVSEATLEHKVKETIRQIGARIVEETVE